uniref:ATP-binding cassette domain-containing protein n=1 Tax=uncultured Olegusella sp. TaxID=1979846 RepID=UPI0026117694
MIALADKISKSFGGRVLYSGATLQLNAGERWALVGPNGAGKTTLLKIVMGQEVPDEGTVSFARDI